MVATFSQILNHATGGRRYCFVIMSYHRGYAFFERIKRIVGEDTGFECLRAVDIPGAGEDLRAKIHAAIENAVFVIADISHLRENIYYEIGYGVARGKPVLIVAQDEIEIPTDLLGVELIRYADTEDGLRRFDQGLRQHLAIHKDSNISLLRAMIIPAAPEPSYVILNPKSPQNDSRFLRRGPERRTYGDYLGVAGVFGASPPVSANTARPTSSVPLTRRTILSIPMPICSSSARRR